MSSKLNTVYRAGLFFFLPLIIFVWTSVPALSKFTLHLALVLGLTAGILAFIKKKDSRAAAWRLTASTIYIAFIITLVGATGWFFSPFFFLLYLAPLYLGFQYNPAVAFSFLAALLIIFSSSVGEVDVAYDVLTLISLLLVIPLVIYLRRSYLILRQSAKDILILEDDSGIKDADTIGKLLANRVTSLGVNMRQPLTYVKQAATVLLQGSLSKEDTTKYLQRMRTTATETLEMIRKFEGDTSANVVLQNRADRVISKPK